MPDYPSRNDAQQTRLGPGKSLVVIVALVLAELLGGSLAPGQGTLQPIWPAVGIGIAILTLYGLRHWKLVLFSSAISFIISAAGSASPPDVLLGDAARSVVCVCQTVLAAWLLRRSIGTRPSFRRPSQVMRFLAILTLCTGAGAWASWLAMRLINAEQRIAPYVLHWWFGHIVGAGAFAPLALLWLGQDWPQHTKGQWCHGLGYQIIFSALLIWASGGAETTDPRVFYRLNLLILPMIMISTLRSGPQSGAVAIVSAVIIEAAALARGRGWLALTVGVSSVAALQVLLLVLEVSGLYAGALSAQHQDTNAALAESEERYRSLVDGAPIAIVVAQNGVVIYANQAAAKTMAADSTEALNGMPIIPETGDSGADTPTLSPRDQFATLDAGNSRHPRIRRKDGEYIEVEVVGSKITYQGKPAFQLVFMDITERKRAEEALRASEARFATVFEATPSMVVLTNVKNMRIVDINEGGCKLLGWQRDELIGRRHSDLGIWADPDEPGRLRSALRERGSYRDVPVTLLHRDGRPMQVLLSSENVQIDGEPCTLTVGSDITALDTAQKALAESERRYRALSTLTADMAYEAHFTPELALAIDWATGAIETITGHSQETFESLQLSKDTFHPDDLEIARQHLARVLGGQDDEAEFRIRRADGSYCWIRNSMHPGLNAQGDVAHVLGAAKDVTVQRGLEEQLAQAQKMEAVGRLAGGIAHDFNNLLTIINGYAEMSIMGLSADDPLRADIAEIQRAGERAAELTRQMLAFSRSERRLVQPVGVNQLVKGMRRMLDRVIREDIDLVIDLEPDLGVILADPTQLEQVLLNLVINARDALGAKDPPGGTLTVSTANLTVDEPIRAYEQTVLPGRYVLLSVIDTGTGIPAELRDHLFEPFFTTKEVGQGTGLGLATVYGIVRQNEGFVDVESELGSGAKFVVGWPRAGDGPLHLLNAPDQKMSRSGNGTILLVEDAAGVRRLTQTMLTSLGYGVIEASSGAEALDLLARPELHVDLMLSDLVMPTMGGKECAAIVSHMRPDLPILFMSGYSQDVNDLGGKGNDLRILAKPFDRQELAHALLEAFGE